MEANPYSIYGNQMGVTKAALLITPSHSAENYISLVKVNSNSTRLQGGKGSPSLDVVERDGAKALWVDADTVPLHGAPVGVLVRLLAIQRAAVVADAAGAEREEHDGPPIPQPLLHRLLPDLPHQYRLHGPPKAGNHRVSSDQLAPN